MIVPLRRLFVISSMALAAALLLPLVVVLSLRWIDPPTTAFMLRARSHGVEVRQQWVDWDDISPELAIAVVAAEDQTFPIHHGFDVASIRSALREKRARQRGASTISQQVAKNLFLWPGHSWLRKGVEAYLTICIEILWPKQRILEVYLNIAEFGPGVFGAESAARSFFRKSAADLRRTESALLGAVLPNPVRLSAAEPSRYVRERASWIVRQIEQLGGPAYLDGM